MRELLIATHNKGKIPEMEIGLTGLDFKFLTMDDGGFAPDFRVEECAETFEGNALIKAFVCGKKSGKLTIADDSGLETEALEGEPGVKSARYVEGSDADRYNVVLHKMESVPDDKRMARFVSVIAFYDPSTDKIRTTKGECAGRILREPRGERGFGYDPIFYVDELGKTFAEATLEQKQNVDHRGKALAKMREILVAEFV